MNNKRPKTDTTDDWMQSNPEGAVKGISMLLILAGFICFFATCKFQPRPLQNAKPSINKPQSSLNNSSEKENLVKDYWAMYGTIGDFAAGTAGTLFSLAGFILLYLSFKKQTEANKTQLDAYNHDKVEGRFFELIRLHRENVNELQFETHFIKEKTTKKGKKIKITATKSYQNRHVFVAILTHFKSAFFELGFFFDGWKPEDIYTADYLKKLKDNKILIDRKIDLIKYAKVDLIYLVIFFGVGKEGQETIISLARDKYDEAYLNFFLSVAALKPKEDSNYYNKWCIIQMADGTVDVMEKIIKARKNELKIVPVIYASVTRDGRSVPYNVYYDDYYEKFYGGHQFRLGHYFRHIFHTISFINDNAELSSDEQYNYVKHLRGQLSTTEQILVFLNSLSQLGRIWELEDKKTGKEVERWKQIMTDYMVIKNIPNDEVIQDIRLTHFYPDIIFEGFEMLKT